MDIRRLSERKRRGEELSADELRWIMEAYTAGEIDDAPMAAWLMAVCCAGMSDEETRVLTEAMARSGEMLDLSGIDAPTVDKHSTGGVGDKMTLVAGPIVAACGGCVVKMSGRGLGHTGGTIDKLEAIPGLHTDLRPDELLAQARAVGLVVAAQSARLAPADGKMYALRDATGTVDSRALIASSIMSKKLAAGAGAIVLDVTVGSGAFMQTEEEARALAELMVAIGRGAGRSMAALLTDMNRPLGRAVGNAVEVEEAAALLAGGGPGDAREVALEISAWMLLTSGLADEIEAAREVAQEALRSGSAAAKLAEMIEAQGGEASALDRTLLGHEPVEVGRWGEGLSGIVTRMDARGVGLAALATGAGRRRKSDAVDPAAGLRIVSAEGERTRRGEALVEVMASSSDHLERAFAELDEAIVVSDRRAEERPSVIAVIPTGGRP
ncbi:MAG: thymidine phosphorylase [Armatimonadota bacterium]|jgi:pyrimidine-nucleoside phosphorylase